MEIRFYFWKISIGVIFEIEVLPIGKIRMAKNCIFIKELFNVVDLPGKSSVGISSSHHQSSLSCWRKDTSKGFSPSLSNNGEKGEWGFIEKHRNVKNIAMYGGKTTIVCLFRYNW